jgi:hypothetical protein
MVACANCSVALGQAWGNRDAAYMQTRFRQRESMSLASGFRQFLH